MKVSLLDINQVAKEQINQIEKKCSEIKPLVAINCITYNHEAYLREALDGFIMQKTDFPFVAIVHDDASTDGTAEIIREYAYKYPDIILPIYETENQYSKRDGSLSRIMYAARNATGAKYIAYCEGDDYWTDPLKLQKQVEYLEAHPDCSLCSTMCNAYIQSNRSLIMYGTKDETGKLEFNDLIIHNFIPTLTVVVRTEALKGYNAFIREAPNWIFGDYPKWLYAAAKGYIMKFPETMGVYRVLENSASHNTNAAVTKSWVNSEFSMLDYFNERIYIPKDVYIEALFNRCDTLGVNAINLQMTDIVNKIKSFYYNNHFFMAWISFVIMSKFPKFKFITKIIESHHILKAPSIYIKRNIKNT